MTWHTKWRANCAYPIMWRVDCLINLVFHFFKNTRDICA